MLEIGNIEIHLTDRCNLSCDYCCHYGNFNIGRDYSLEEIEQWILLWKDRISPRIVSLLGGEPLLNKECHNSFELVDKYWPGAFIRFVTNGTLLSDDNINIKNKLKEYADKVLVEISYHKKEDISKLKNIHLLMCQWSKEFGLKSSFSDSYTRWNKHYRIVNKTLYPFNNVPKNSWKNCVSKKCPQLHDGYIYKCASLAYLKLLTEKIELSKEWEPYINYILLHQG
jgi:organic radical activating enzyme